MKRTILILFIIGLFTNTILSQDSYSLHTVRFYKNDRKVNINISKISIVVDGNEILAERDNGTFQFPIIDSLRTFHLMIESNKMKFVSGPHEAWMLNNGSRISLGRITRINKLLSVAEYNSMDIEDENYKIFESRFFIVDNLYTIDINNYNEIRKLEYLIVNPNQYGDGSYVITQKIIK